jgi:hypothetical protein
MKRLLLIFGLVLVSTLLFADYESGPGGETLGDLNMHQKGQLVRARVAVQNQLMEQEQLGPPAAVPETTPVREGPAQLRAQSGDCVSGCDGEPDQTQTQTRDQSKDGSGDGVPDQDHDGPGYGRPS